MRQRFCQKCDIWFHVGCIKAWKGGRESIQTEDIAGISSKDEDLNRLLRVVIERGFLVGLVGNGQLQLALRDRVRMGQPFGEDLGAYLAHFGDFEYYQCPCGSFI